MTKLLATGKALCLSQKALALQVALVLCILGAGQGIRTPSLQHRPIPFISLLCENTAAGRHYMADSLGMVCQRGDLNRRTGCCTNGTKHSCETCDPNDRCCSSYEHCVSCCLEPSHGAEQLWKTVPRVGGKVETGQWQNAFQYCAGKCRTSSKSTSHENSYIDDRHFCFSPLGRPKTVKNAPPIPDGVQVFVGGKGQDCNAVCQAQRMACSVPGMLSINHCDALREHLPCEAGCQPDPARQDAPSYVVYGSAKPLSPTLCFVRGGADTMSCAAAAAHVQRLCACAAPSEAAAAAAPAA